MAVRALAISLGLAVAASLAAVPAAVSQADTSRLGPGTFWQDASGAGCTLGFILERFETLEGGSERATGDLFALSAAHCFDDASVGEPTTWPKGEGPAVIVGGDEIVGLGRYAFRENDYTGDVALIDLIVDNDRVSPEVCYWGGPTGLHAGRPQGGDTLLLSGAGSNLRPRQVIANDRQDEAVRYDGPQNNGDSGGPVLDADGRALGIVSFGGVQFENSSVSTKGATPVVEALEHVLRATNLDLRLVTAPRAERSYPVDVLDVDCAVNGPSVNLP